MTQAQAFLEAILESPDDDVPRLVFADWLEDEGQVARAELIRVQCRLAGDLSRAERGELVQREKALIEGNREAWLGELGERAYEVRFNRGVACVRLQTARFLGSKGQAVCERWFGPGLVLELHLDGTTTRRSQLLSSPLLARLYRLVLDDPQLSEPDVACVAGCPHLSRLSCLALRGSAGTAASKRLGVKAIRELATSPFLRRLSALDFTLHPLTPEGLDLLTAEHHWPNLASLDLGWTRVTGPQLRNLLSAPWLDRLTRLVLYHSLACEDDVVALASSPRLGRLRQLDLGSNNVGDEAARAIAGSPFLSNLRRLSLRFARISEAGARDLAGSPYLDKLHHLDLYYMAEDDPRAVVLRERFGPVLRVDYTKPM